MVSVKPLTLLTVQNGGRQLPPSRRVTAYFVNTAYSSTVHYQTSYGSERRELQT